MRHIKALFAFLLVTIFVTLSNGQAFASDQGSVSQSILNLYDQEDVIVFGESHVLREARDILMEVLSEGFESGKVTGFSTEYVHELVETQFQSYITDPSATHSSEAERNFFSAIKDSGFIWADDEKNLEFFRFLREQKLKYGNAISICGLDVTESSRVSGEGEDQEIELRRQRFDLFPLELMDHAERVFGKSKEELINEAGRNSDREPMMALRASNCLKNSRKSLVHVGAFHAWAINYSQPHNNWATVSSFLQTTLQTDKIVTIHHYQYPSGRTSPVEFIETNLFAATKSIHFPNGEPLLFKNKDLPEESASHLVLEEGGLNLDLKQIWDYFVFGPEGTHTDFWK